MNKKLVFLALKRIITALKNNKTVNNATFKTPNIHITMKDIQNYMNLRWKSSTKTKLCMSQLKEKAPIHAKRKLNREKV